MESNEFKTGDVVTLASGGASFTVEKNEMKDGKKMLYCKYWNKKADKMDEIILPVEMFIKDRSGEPLEVTLNIVNPENTKREVAM